MKEDTAKIVALGSNLGAFGLSVEQTLERALTRLSDAGLVVVKRSRWWRSVAWPDASDPPFLNGVAVVESAGSPEEALATLHAIEAEFGRDRSPAAVRNAPRPLDLDLIAWGRLMQQGAPVLPHPRAAERRFVMGPLAEIAPQWLHPALDATPGALAELAPIGADAEPLPQVRPDTPEESAGH